VVSEALAVHELVGDVVRLELLSLAHVDELVVAAVEDPSAYAWTIVPSTRQTMTT